MADKKGSKSRETHESGRRLAPLTMGLSSETQNIYAASSET